VPTRGPSPGSVKKPNEYKIHTTPIPDEAHGVDWLGFFNSKLSHPPFTGYHNGGFPVSPALSRGVRRGRSRACSAGSPSPVGRRGIEQADYPPWSASHVRPDHGLLGCRPLLPSVRASARDLGIGNCFSSGSNCRKLSAMGRPAGIIVVSRQQRAHGRANILAWFSLRERQTAQSSSKWRPIPTLT
jgi:hypothetical protein